MKAVAFGYSFIVGSNACMRHQCAAAAPPPLDSAYALLLLLLRNVLGFCCLGGAWVTASLVSSRLERAVRKVPLTLTLTRSEERRVRERVYPCV